MAFVSQLDYFLSLILEAVLPLLLEYFNETDI